MRSILHGSLVVVVLAVAATGAFALEGEGQEEIFKTFRGDLGEAEDVALRERAPVVAAAAFGHLVRANREAIAGPEMVRLMQRFASDEDKLYRAAAILSFTNGIKSQQLQEVVEKLVEADGRSSNHLAAAILAVKNLSLHALKEHMERTALFGKTEETGKKAKARKRQRQFRLRKAAAGMLPVPPELFGERLAVIRSLALQAAALAGDKNCRQEILETFVDKPEFSGAILLYATAIGDELTDEQVRKLFIQAMKNSPHEPERVYQASYDPTLPDGALACMALGKIGTDTAAELAAAALRHRDPRIQIEAMRVIRKLDYAAAVPTVAGMIEGAPWPVLVEACHVLARIPQQASLVPLIEEWERRKGRCRLHLCHALSAIAGEQKGETADEWKEWYVREGQEHTVDREATMAYLAANRPQDVRMTGHGYFYGLAIFSTRFAYVIDTSLSMKGDRIESLRENLVQSLNSLGDDDARGGKPAVDGEPVLFNLVDFGGDVVVLEDDGLTGAVRYAAARAESMPMTLGTRSFDAMERALRFPEVDTLYFLSDGAPVWGQVDAWSAISRALVFLTYHRPVAIYNVAFAPDRANEKAMKEIADGHYGQYDAPL